MAKASKKSEGLDLPGFSLIKNNPLYQTPMDYLHTGNYILNWAIANDAKRGWPLGRIVELYGDPSTGKSLLAFQAMAAMQRRGGMVLLEDVEHAFDPRFGELLGLDTEKVLISSSKTLEDCFSNIHQSMAQMSKAGVDHAVFVLDSLGMLSSKHEEDVGFDKRDMTKAVLIRQGMRMLLQQFANTRYLLIVLNHATSNIGDPINPRTTPGGSGVKFAASVRVELRYGGKLPGKPPKGVYTRFKVSKNRVAPPFREGLLRILFASGVTPWSGTADSLINAEMLEKDKRGFVTFSTGERHRLSSFDEQFPSIAKGLGYDDPAEALNAMLCDSSTDEEENTEGEEDEE